MKKGNYIIFAIFIVVIIGQQLWFNHLMNKNRKFFEQEIQTVKDSILVKEDKEAKIIGNGKKYTQKATDKKKSINNKLKDDETTIDSSDVDDNDIKDFLSKYNERQRNDP